MYVNYGHHDSHDESAKFLARLAKAMRFSDEDLTENRAGRLSTPQMVRLPIQAILPFAGMAVSAAGLVGIAAGLAMGSHFLVAKVRLLLAFSKYLALGLGALFFGLVAFVVKFMLASGRMLQLLLDFMDGKVTTVGGRATPSRTEELEDGLNTILRRKTETFSFVIRDEYFEVPEAAYSLLLESDASNLSLFVTPRSRYVVAVVLAPASKSAGGEGDPFKFKPKLGETAA